MSPSLTASWLRRRLGATVARPAYGFDKRPFRQPLCLVIARLSVEPFGRPGAFERTSFTPELGGLALHRLQQRFADAAEARFGSDIGECDETLVRDCRHSQKRPIFF